VADSAWTDIGERVRQSRLAAGLTQTELADRLRLDRTALAKIEAGTRQVGAMELFRLSDTLGLPAAHFVLPAPQAIVSRRAPLLDEPDVAARSAYFLDADLASHVRDADWLVGAGLLLPGGAITLTHTAGTQDQGRELARLARAALGLPVEPLGGLAEVCERFGLYVLPVDRDAEGASVLLDGYGAAVIGAKREPGRRRWTAAHELGHHLLGDAYHSDVGVAASGRRREAVIDAFAGELLLPAAAVHAEWSAGTDDPRCRLIRLAGSYRLSWTASVQAVARAGVVDAGTARVLRSDVPTRGDFQDVLGFEPTPDLPIGGVGPAWRAAALTAWKSGAITAARTAELLHGQLAADELPRRQPPPIRP
jgi:transcriptional regulator with XRE-family HTH domain